MYVCVYIHTHVQTYIDTLHTVKIVVVVRYNCCGYMERDKLLVPRTGCHFVLPRFASVPLKKNR